MGSYIKIGIEEINSKTNCKIIIDCVRSVDSRLKSKECHLKKSKKLSKAEYYKTDKDGEPFGCGDWKLHRKAVALIMNDLQLLINDEYYLKSFITEEYEYHIEKCCKTEEDIVNFIKQKVPDVQDDIERCFNTMYRILFHMVLQGKKWIKLKWV